MKILLLPAYFIPEQIASTHLMSNLHDALSEAKIYRDCYVATPTRGVTDEVRKNTKKSDILFDGYLKVHRFSMYRESTSPVMRALRYVLCWCKQFYYGCRAKDIDLIYLVSTPPIQGVLGGILKKIKKVPFVYNLQDIFPDSLVGTGLAKKDGFLWKIGRVIENFTYNNADRIIVISEGFKRNIIAKGVPEEKIVVIHNWVDEEVVKHVDREDNVLFDRYGLDREKFYITYSGNIGHTQNMDMLLEVAKDLENEPDIQFVLIGEGACKERVKEIIKKKSINNITLLPFQPYKDISHVFSLGDVGLVISKSGVGENSVPSKTWSILSASRPVLANFDENELKEILNKHKCGIFTKAGDKDAFKQAILHLYHDKKRCKELGQNGRKFILDNVTRAVCTRKYVNVIKSFDRIV